MTQKKRARPTKPDELMVIRNWVKTRADECMEGKRPTVARRHFAQAFLTVFEKCNLMLAHRDREK